MALSATFQADFSSFLDAVEKADVKLKTFQDDAGKVETSLTRMSNSLSGTRVIQDAALMVEAVERVGGVSKLTEAELAKVSRTASEAAEKLKALGQDVPVGIQKLADASKGAAVQSKEMSSGFDLSWTSISRFAGALGIGFGISQLVQFGKSVFDTASNVSDLSVKLGTSAEFVQRMSFAAGQTGTTIDTVGTAIAKMNATLSAGETGTIEALKKAGLSFDNIRKMRPEDAFLEISEAIKKINEPMLQAELAVKLFGKSGQELLPAIKQGIKEIGEQASIMSDDTVNKLDAAGDAWDKFKGRISNLAGEAVFVPIIAGLNLVLDIGTQISHLDVMGFVQALSGLGPEFEAVKTHGKSVSGAIDAIAGSITVAHPTISGMSQGLRDANEVLAEFDAANKQNAETMRASIAALDAHAASVKALVDQWSGAKLAERVKLYSDALLQLGGGANITASELGGVVKQIDEFRKQGAQLDPLLLDLWMKTNDFNAVVDTSGQSLKRALDATKLYNTGLATLPPAIKAIEDALPPVATKTDEFTESIKRSAQAAQQLDATWTVLTGHLASDSLGSMIGDAAWMKNFFNSLAPNVFSQSLVQPRAMGGPVSAGQTYLVGEQRPELFTPSVSGYISPSVGGGGSRITIPVSITVQGSIVGTKEELARIASEAIGQRFADLGLS